MTNKLYYVLYLDDNDYETSAFVMAPNKHIAENLLSPAPVLEVVEVEDDRFEMEILDQDDAWDEEITGEAWWEVF